MKNAASSVAQGGARELVNFAEEVRSRNAEILTAEEQGAIDAMRILVAGCGSVGGAIIEPLARLGTTSFVLADPERYELSNINRQACFVADVGRPKVEVLAERIRSIQPQATVQSLEEGLTADNLPEALEGVTIVFDGVDAAMSLWVKYLLHKEAAHRRLPVICGADYGGSPTLYVWDYRRDPRPFYGQVTEDAHREGRYDEAMKWLGVKPFPADFLPVVRARRFEARPWPQVAYCSLALGALASRAALDLSLGRPVPPVVSADVHMLTRNRRERLRARARWPVEVARTLRAVRQTRGKVPPTPTETDGGDSQLPPLLRVVAEAIGLAPSRGGPHPWVVEAGQPDRLRLSRVEAVELPPVSQRCLWRSVGCAVEAAASVAEIEYHGRSRDGRPANGDLIGELRVERLRDRSVTRALGLLRLRRTTRAPFATDAPDPELLERLIDAGVRDGVEMGSVSAESDLIALASEYRKLSVKALLDFGDASRDGSSSPSEEASRVMEVWPAEERGAAKRAAEFLRRSGPAMGALGMRRAASSLVARKNAALLRQSGAVLLLRTNEADPAGDVSVGRALLRVWLAATEAGLGVQPISIPPSLERGETLTHLFGVSRAEGSILMRIGYPTPRG